MTTLRTRLAKLAHDHPETRRHLVALLRLAELGPKVQVQIIHLLEALRFPDSNHYVHSVDFYGDNIVVVAASNVTYKVDLEYDHLTPDEFAAYKRDLAALKTTLVPLITKALGGFAPLFVFDTPSYDEKNYLTVTGTYTSKEDKAKQEKAKALAEKERAQEEKALAQAKAQAEAFKTKLNLPAAIKLIQDQFAELTKIHYTYEFKGSINKLVGMLDRAELPSVKDRQAIVDLLQKEISMLGQRIRSNEGYRPGETQGQADQRRNNRWSDEAAIKLMYGLRGAIESLPKNAEDAKADKARAQAELEKAKADKARAKVEKTQTLKLLTEAGFSPAAMRILVKYRFTPKELAALQAWAKTPGAPKPSMYHTFGYEDWRKLVPILMKSR